MSTETPTGDQPPSDGAETASITPAPPDETDQDSDGVAGVITSLVDASESGLSAAAEYVRTNDGRQMLATLDAFLRNNPGVSLAVAAAFGFVVGRSIKRD